MGWAVVPWVRVGMRLCGLGAVPRESKGGAVVKGGAALMPLVGQGGWCKAGLRLP